MQANVLPHINLNAHAHFDSFNGLSCKNLYILSWSLREMYFYFPPRPNMYNLQSIQCDHT